MEQRAEGNRSRVRAGVLAAWLLTGTMLGGGCHARVLEIAAPEGSVSHPTVERNVHAANQQEVLGDEYYQQNRWHEALAAWRRALELDPQRTGLEQRIADVASGRTPALATASPIGNTLAGSLVSQEELEFTLTQDLRRADRYYAQSQLKEAERVWQSVLALNPTNTQARAGLQRLREEVYQEDPKRAFDQTTRDLYVDGLRAYRQEDWPAAESRLAEAAKLNPEQPQVKEFLDRTRAQIVRLKDQERAGRLALQATEAEKQQNWREAHRLWLDASRMQPPATGAAEGVSRCARMLENTAAAQIKQANQALAAGRAREALTG